MWGGPEESGRSAEETGDSPWDAVGGGREGGAGELHSSAASSLLIFLTLCVPALKAPPARHSWGSLVCGVRREGYIYRWGGEKVRGKVRFHEANPSVELMRLAFLAESAMQTQPVSLF